MNKIYSIETAKERLYGRQKVRRVDGTIFHAEKVGRRVYVFAKRKGKPTPYCPSIGTFGVLNKNMKFTK